MVSGYFIRTMIFLLLISMPAYGDVRLKDIAYVKNQSEIQLKGLGLVTGLQGTGDGKNTQFTIRMIGNMMKRMGIEVPSTSIKVKNAAAVMVTATVSPYTKIGGVFDITVSSVGDAKSLEGGTLLLTALSDTDDILYAEAQGALSTGGANKNYGGAGIITNATLAGKIPGGGYLKRQLPDLGMDEKSVTVSLREPDYTTAYRLATAINDHFETEMAISRDAGNVIVAIPEAYSSKNDLVKFISEVEMVTFIPDISAKVVINERTGTIIAGANVSLAPVAIMQGNLALTIGQNNQPQQNTPGNNGDRMVSFGEASNVGEISRALNLLGVTPRDLIAIFQALKASGSLRAELVII